MNDRVLRVLLYAVPLWLMGIAGGYFILTLVGKFPVRIALVCAFVGAIASGWGIVLGAIRAQRALGVVRETTRDKRPRLPVLGWILLALGLLTSALGTAFIFTGGGLVGGIVASAGATGSLVGVLIVLRSLRRLGSLDVSSKGPATH